ncbi:hypothetical protein ES705_00013 [subsurface metagenome]|nr:hypothetical protein [Clostridia bacterium]
MKLKPYIGEPDINRLIAALRGEAVDRVPNFDVIIDDKHVEKFLGRYAGNTLAVGGDPAKGPEELEDVRPMYPKDNIELCNLIGQDAVTIEQVWTPFKKYNELGKLIPITNRSVKKRSDWEKVIYPNQSDIDSKLFYIREYKKVLKGTKIGITVTFGAIMQTLYHFIIGTEDFMMLIYDDRDFLEETLEVSTQYWEKFCQSVVDEGIDFIFPADDVAFKTGLFIRPKIFKEIWIPRMARIIKPAIEKNIPVMFHSCGKIDDIVIWLSEIGVNCITPMDPSGINYRDYKKRFGNLITLLGNIGVEFPLAKGTIRDVEKDVKEHMEILKPGYRYICGSSHSLINFIPHENIIAYLNAVHKYGKY